MVTSVKVEPKSKKKVKVRSERKVGVKSVMMVDHTPIISSNQDPNNSMDPCLSSLTNVINSKTNIQHKFLRIEEHRLKCF